LPVQVRYLAITLIYSSDAYPPVKERKPAPARSPGELLVTNGKMLVNHLPVQVRRFAMARFLGFNSNRIHTGRSQSYPKLFGIL
jgi:hypothetical protein